MLRHVLTSVNVSDSGCYLPSKTDVWQPILPDSSDEKLSIILVLFLCFFYC